MVVKSMKERSPKLEKRIAASSESRGKSGWCKRSYKQIHCNLSLPNEKYGGADGKKSYFSAKVKI
jgi:hypothetical protein